jgi:hypothetical protein
MAKAKKELPKVSVIDRRLANPFGLPSQAIYLKEGQWALRWFAESVRTGRIYQAQQLGWDFVLPEELRGTPSDAGAIIVDGRVVRGDAGNREILMKMAAEDFAKIQKAKADKNLRDLGSVAKLKESAANKASTELGDQAANAIYNTNIEITSERVAYDLEDDRPAT